MRTTLSIIILAGVVEITTPAIQAQPQFKGMGTPPPGIYGQTQMMQIHAVSEIGEVFGTVKGSAITWSSGDGYQLLPPLVANAYSGIDSCTSNGAILAGIVCETPANERAIPARWLSRALPPTAIVGFPAGWTCYNAVCSGNGKVVAGYMQELATSKPAIYIWRAGVRKNMGWEFITQFPPGILAADIVALSDDGGLGVGGAITPSLDGFSGSRWTKTSGLQIVPDLPGGNTDAAFGSCDATGFRAAGAATPASNIRQAAVWDPVNGWSVLGVLKPTDVGSGVIGDRSGWRLVGGSKYSGTGYEAIIWDPIDKMRSIEELLVNDYGLVEATPWQLGGSISVSPNGRFIAGTGKNPQSVFETWWAEIKPFCYADCDNSTSPKGKDAGPPVLDIDDFICFQTKFAIGDYLYADCDLNGYLEVDDYICFQTKFALGCQ
jgi:hypothetical protein